MNEQEITLKKVISTLLIIFSIFIVVFYGISFISGAPDLTNKFLIYFGVFLVLIELLALTIWKIASFFKKK